MDYSSSTLPPANNTRKKLLFVMGGLVAFLGLFVFLFFTIPGKKIVNSIFPTSYFTLNLASKGIVAISNYESSIDSQSYSAEVIEMLDEGAQYGINFKEFVIASSTVFRDTKGYKTSIIRLKEGDLYAQDQYDKTYSLLQNSSVPREVVEEIKNLTPNNLFSNLVSSENKKVTKNRDGNAEFLTVQGFLSGDELGIPTDIHTISATFDFSTYQIRTISLIGNGKSIDISLHSFNKERQKVSFAMTDINEFGDFVARESVIYRTDPEGSHDYLWFLWEKEHFNCVRCVNRVYDDDKDGLRNDEEFLFGTNPSKNDSDEDGVKDKTELETGRNPVGAGAIPASPPYAEATIWVLSLSKLEPAEGPPTITDPAGRSPVLAYSGFRVGNLSRIKIPYTFYGSANSGDYLTVFFDNTLLFKTVRESSDVNQVMDLSLESVKGKTGTIYFILNSYGPANKGEKGLEIDIKATEYISAD